MRDPRELTGFELEQFINLYNHGVAMHTIRDRLRVGMETIKRTINKHIAGGALQPQTRINIIKAGQQIRALEALKKFMANAAKRRRERDAAAGIKLHKPITRGKSNVIRLAEKDKAAPPKISPDARMLQPLWQSGRAYDGTTYTPKGSHPCLRQKQPAASITHA